MHAFTRTPFALALALALGVTLSTASQASVIVNWPGDVTLGGLHPVSPAFAGWSTAGDVSAPDDHTLLLTTAFDAQDDMDGSVVVGSGAIPAQQWRGVEELAGLPIGALDTTIDGVVQQATEGSVISRTLHISAGDTLSFRWQLLSNEDPLTGLPDLAFMTFGGQLTELGTPEFAELPGFGGFQHSSGWQTFTHTFTEPDLVALTPVELAFGVVDRGDTSISTALAIQGVTVTPVPEPATWGLMASGLLAWVAQGGARRRPRS